MLDKLLQYCNIIFYEVKYINFNNNLFERQINSSKITLKLKREINQIKFNKFFANYLHKIKMEV